MSHDKADQSAAAASTSCPLYPCGCRILISQNLCDGQCHSREHIESMIDDFEQQRDEDEISRALLVGLSETNTPPTEAATSVHGSEQIFRQLSDLSIRHAESSNTINPLPDTSTSIDQIYNRSTPPVQPLILQQDRTTDHVTNLQSNQAEIQVHNYRMWDAANHAMTSSTMSRENDLAEQHRNALQWSNAQQRTDGLQMMASILETSLESEPVSTDGCLIWIIEKFCDSKTHGPHIESPPFKTSMNGHRVWARLILKNPTNPRFISIRVHLNFPFLSALQATIKFALVDQSKNQPLKHHIKSCSGILANVNDFLGVDDFIEQNSLANSQYMRNGSICLIVKIEQIATGRFVNYPANIQDALLQLESTV